MKNKIIWRLKEQPSSESLRELVKDGILTKEEAREILFSSETEGERDKESLKSEIKFLRELVEKLSSSQTRTVEIIREIERPWRRYPWYEPYVVWCNSTSGSYTLTNSTTTTTDSGTTNATYLNTTTAPEFSNIKTF